MPTVIVAANYAKVPLRRPRFGDRGIWECDGGVCQYTGRKLAPKEGNIDHDPEGDIPHWEEGE